MQKNLSFFHLKTKETPTVHFATLKENMEFERKEMLPVGPLDNVADMVGLSQLLAKMTYSVSFVKDCDLLHCSHTKQNPASPYYDS